ALLFPNAGAVEKKDYLAFIKEAGFHDVKIIAQNTIPINSMVNNPAVKAIMKNLKMPQEQFQKLATSIASVRVFGIKPD
ncbi:MAG: arsenite S-adenosylmethyltransferase, partial [Actinobacteria bacterium]|nr:arsenite S-adenosylmethyltransferase [Actinomycetota bacterium]